MSKNYHKDLILRDLEAHLSRLGVSASTIKNYSSDIRTFESWLRTKVAETGAVAESIKECIPFLSPPIAQEFRDFLTQKYQKLAVNRRLASLRALSRFLIESQIIDSDFMEGVSNLGTQADVLEKHPAIADFRKHLETEKVSPNTIKNYVSDIKHFLTWMENR